MTTFKIFNRFYLHLENMCFYFVLCAAQLSMWDCNSSVHKLLLFKMKSVKWWWWYQDEKCEMIIIMIMMTITITTTTQQQKHCRAMEISHHPGCYVMPGKVLLQAIFTLGPFRPQGIVVPCAVRPSVCPSVRPALLPICSSQYFRIMFIFCSAIDLSMSTNPIDHEGSMLSSNILWHFEILRIHWLTCFIV